jgi:hypothetical protein
VDGEEHIPRLLFRFKGIRRVEVPEEQIHLA